MNTFWVAKGNHSKEVPTEPCPTPIVSPGSPQAGQSV